MAELISVIVTTFNREDALDAVLRSLAIQSDRDFEVIVADDGSGAATAKLIDAWKPKFAHRLEHVWHADQGFRAAEIRNRAILAARGTLLYFPGRRLHRAPRFCRDASAAGGARLVRDRQPRPAFAGADDEGAAGESGLRKPGASGRWLGERSRGGVNRLSALLTLPLGVLRRLRKNAWQGARSCNLAIWRSDLDRVDGFDADYRGWGKEDSDIIARLLHAGVRRKDGIFATGVIHLWHPEADRSQLARNEDKLADVLAGDRVRALRGLSSLQGASTTAARAS